jgi:glyoxylase-like metal-dependent hydrolase (beta-lactamase superfamily II)
MTMALIFKQLVCPETSTYTYIVGDAATKEVAIIDSVREHFETYRKLIDSNDWTLRYMIETHVHADHVTANSRLKEAYPQAQIALYAKAPVKCSFMPLHDGDTLQVGSIIIQALHTPGHTSDDMCFLVDGDRLLTGDTLFINSCGRTDFQAGDASLMHASLQRLVALAPETLIYPGHDYNGRFVTSLNEQLIHNPLLKMDLQAFTQELASWKLPPPRKIKESVPANLTCGREG